jgi:predicted  nucleic acid-binding Zn-ribbon protein
MTNGPNDIPMPVTPQMILANMNETNQRMQRLELIINDKLSKLDLLDVLNDKLGKFEQNLSNMQTEIVNIKSVQQKQAQTLQNVEKHHHNIEDRIRELELCNRK